MPPLAANVLPWPGSSSAHPVFGVGVYANPQPLIDDGGVAVGVAHDAARAWLGPFLGKRLLATERVRRIALLRQFVLLYLLAAGAALSQFGLPIGLTFDGVGVGTYLSAPFVGAIVAYLCDSLILFVEDFDASAKCMQQNLNDRIKDGLVAGEDGLKYDFGSKSCVVARLFKLTFTVRVRKAVLDWLVKDFDADNLAVKETKYGVEVRFFSLEHLLAFFPAASLFKNPDHGPKIFHCPLWIKNYGWLIAAGQDFSAEKSALWKKYGGNMRYLRVKDRFLVRLLRTEEMSTMAGAKVLMVLVLLRQIDLPDEAVGMVWLTPTFPVRGHVRWLPRSMLESQCSVPLRVCHNTRAFSSQGKMIMRARPGPREHVLQRRGEHRAVRRRQLDRGARVMPNPRVDQFKAVRELVRYFLSVEVRIERHGGRDDGHPPTSATPLALLLYILLIAEHKRPYPPVLAVK